MPRRSVSRSPSYSRRRCSRSRSPAVNHRRYSRRDRKRSSRSSPLYQSLSADYDCFFLQLLRMCCSRRRSRAGTPGRRRSRSPDLKHQRSSSPTPGRHRARKSECCFSCSPKSPCPSSVPADCKYDEENLKKEEEKKRPQNEAVLKQLKEETARRLLEEVQKRVEEKLCSEEVRLEIERLIESQKKLFDDVEAQFQKGKEAALTEARQKKEQARKEREEMDTILEENQWRVDEAKRQEALELQLKEEERLRELELVQSGVAAARREIENVHADQTLLDGSKLGRSQHEFCTDSHQPQPLHPLPRPHAMHEAILRVFEKERIRDEIIISEIARRRVLETDVKRELMMDRELPLRRSSDGFLFGSSPQMEYDSPLGLAIKGSRFDGRSVEERTAMSLEETKRLSGRHESGEFDTLPFQRGNVDLIVSEVNPFSGGSKEKLILLAKPNENISEPKSEAMTVTPPRVDASELHEISKKVAREEWSCAACQVIFSCEQSLNEHMQVYKHKSYVAKSCALCQISTTCELNLHQHLQGKKHKLKETQRAGKNYTIGLWVPKKATKSIEALGAVDPDTEHGAEFTAESLVFEEEKNQSELVQKDDPIKTKYNFWCEMCKVGVLSETVMDGHIKGKKHAKRLKQIFESGGAGPSYPENIAGLLNL